MSQTLTVNQASMNKITLCALGYHLDEVIESLAWALRKLGYEVSTPPLGAYDPAELNILFSAFELNPEELPTETTRFINYNFEQIGGAQRSPIGAVNFSLMRNMPNWDYSRANIRALNQSGVCDVALVPIGYAPGLERIRHLEKDIDVLFYGSVNERRTRTLEAIRRKGLNVVWDDPWELSREMRDDRISRAKVVINLAFYDGIHIFEEVRVSYLLANRVCVLSELTELTQIEDDMRQCVDGASLDLLPDLCVQYCADPERRRVLADRGYEILRARDWLSPLKSVLENYFERRSTGSKAIKYDVDAPPRINIGSGRSWRHDFLNIDLNADRGADVIFDLSAPFEYDKWIHTWRFGKLKLPRAGFDFILAEHVLEHVGDLVQCMTTCLDWLRVGGTLEIEVPYDLSYGAWQDPTHVRAFNERSWAYYTDWCWYIGWREYRFDLVSQVHILSEVGQALADAGIETDVVIRTPRAVDALRAKLVKRQLTDAEKIDHRQYFRNVS